MSSDIGSMIQMLVVMVPPIIFAVAFHEVAHGYVASLKGDQTAKLLGRLTLNPLAHIDPFGTLLLPFFFYMTVGVPLGYAKPVPIDYRHLKNPRQDMALIAAAGPISNVLLAVASATVIQLIQYFFPESAVEFNLNLRGLTGNQGSTLILPLLFMFFVSLKINIVLAVINLIPIPPADGGRVVAGFLPDTLAEQYARIEPYGLFILMMILMLNPMNLVDSMLRPIINGVINFLL